MSIPITIALEINDTKGARFHHDDGHDDGEPLGDCRDHLGDEQVGDLGGGPALQPGDDTHDGEDAEQHDDVSLREMGDRFGERAVGRPLLCQLRDAGEVRFPAGPYHVPPPGPPQDGGSREEAVFEVIGRGVLSDTGRMVLDDGQ